MGRGQLLELLPQPRPMDLWPAHPDEHLRLQVRSHALSKL